MDVDLRDLLLMYLLLANEPDCRATVVPRGIILHVVMPDQFADYHTQLTGVTASNRESVWAVLAEKGFDGRGRPLKTLSRFWDEVD